MRLAVVCLFVLGLFLTCGIALADSYNPNRIAECIEDNTDARVSTETLRKWCVCMNGKMPLGETQSITEWEKSHPVEMAICDREAGWR